MPGIFDSKDKMKGKHQMGIVAPAALATAVAGTGVAALGGPALASTLIRNIQKGNWGPIEKDPVSLAQKLLAAGGRNAKDFTFGTSAHPGGPHYRPPLLGQQEHVHLPKRLATPMIVSHEVGHAAATNPFSKALRTARVMPFGGMLAPLLLAGSTLAGDRDATELNIGQKASVPLALLHAGVVQGEELRASFLGRKLLKQIGRETPHFWKQLLTTQGTYALSNLATMAPVLGGAYALKKVLDRRKGVAGRKKTAAELANHVIARL